jgi:putative transcriptional regulator
MRTARVSNNLRRLRFEFGEMTQQELAEQVDVTRQTIIAIEGEKYSPSLELAFRIAKAAARAVVARHESGANRPSNLED